MIKYSKLHKTGGKNPCSNKDFWLKPENHFWETESYTKEGKEYLRKFVEKIRKTGKLKDGKSLNRNHL